MLDSTILDNFNPVSNSSFWSFLRKVVEKTVALRTLEETSEGSGFGVVCPSLLLLNFLVLDTINHGILLDWLQKLGVGSRSWADSLPPSGSVPASVDTGERSSWHPLFCEVHQSSILSVFLFTIYMCH